MTFIFRKSPNTIAKRHLFVLFILYICKLFINDVYTLKNKFICRWKSGVASSLNVFQMSDEKSPVLQPYPSWEANTLPETEPTTESTYGGGRTDAKEAEKADNLLEKNNQTIISTFRIRADECDRLWVMDSGLADILGSPKQWAPNSIAVFDLNTDKLIRRFSIPADQVKEDSFFANIVSSDYILSNEFIFTECNFFRSSILKHQTVAMLLLTFPISVHMLSLYMTLKMINLTVLSTTSSTLTLFKEI